MGSAKASAILGGQQSSLSAILSTQGAAAAPVVPAALDPRSPLAPRPAFAHASRPDIFGTVALSVGRTPFDRRWNHVASASPGASAERFARDLAYASEREAIDRINRYVNARVAYVEDRDRFGVADRWVRAADTLAAGQGDCEDYAIAKMAMLRAAGFDADDLYLVIAKDLVRRNDHAVLVVRSEGRFLMLDNYHDQLVDASAMRDLRPVLTYSAGQSWTHGYERAAPYPEVRMAAAPQTGNELAIAPQPVSLSSAALPIPAASLLLR